MKRENNSLKRILVLIKIGVAMIIVLLSALVVVHYIKDKSFKASEANENELAGENESITYGIDKDKRSNIAIAFMDSVYAAGYTPMIYSAAYELIDDTSWNTSELERKYKVWLARYTGVSERPTGKPDYYGQCSMWQYTDQGYVDGILGNVDLDVAYFGYDGTESAKNLSPREETNPDVEFQTWIQKEETSEFKTKFTPCAENVTAKERVNLRSKPSVTDEDSVVVYTLEAGEIARRTGINFDVGWSRVEYNGQELYCVSSYIYVVE